MSAGSERAPRGMEEEVNQFGMWVRFLILSVVVLAIIVIGVVMTMPR